MLMKKLLPLFLFCLITGSSLFAYPFNDGFVTGEMDVQSINALAFGPDNVLFIGDSK